MESSVGHIDWVEFVIQPGQQRRCVDGSNTDDGPNGVYKDVCGSIRRFFRSLDHIGDLNTDLIQGRTICDGSKYLIYKKCEPNTHQLEQTLVSTLNRGLGSNLLNVLMLPDKDPSKKSPFASTYSGLEAIHIIEHIYAERSLNDFNMVKNGSTTDNSVDSMLSIITASGGEKKSLENVKTIYRQLREKLTHEKLTRNRVSQALKEVHHEFMLNFDTNPLLLIEYIEDMLKQDRYRLQFRPNSKISDMDEDAIYRAMHRIVDFMHSHQSEITVRSSARMEDIIRVIEECEKEMKDNDGSEGKGRQDFCEALHREFDSRPPLEVFNPNFLNKVCDLPAVSINQEYNFIVVVELNDKYRKYDCLLDPGQYIEQEIKYKMCTMTDSYIVNSNFTSTNTHSGELYSISFLSQILPFTDLADLETQRENFRKLVQNAIDDLSSADRNIHPQYPRTLACSCFNQSGHQGFLKDKSINSEHIVQALKARFRQLGTKNNPQKQLRSYSARYKYHISSLPSNNDYTSTNFNSSNGNGDVDDDDGTVQTRNTQAPYSSIDVESSNFNHVAQRDNDPPPEYSTIISGSSDTAPGENFRPSAPPLPHENITGESGVVATDLYPPIYDDAMQLKETTTEQKSSEFSSSSSSSAILARNDETYSQFWIDLADSLYRFAGELYAKNRAVKISCNESDFLDFLLYHICTQGYFKYESVLSTVLQFDTAKNNLAICELFIHRKLSDFYAVVDEFIYVKWSNQNHVNTCLNDMKCLISINNAKLKRLQDVSTNFIAKLFGQNIAINSTLTYGHSSALLLSIPIREPYGQYADLLSFPAFLWFRDLYRVHRSLGYNVITSSKDESLNSQAGKVKRPYEQQFLRIYADCPHYLTQEAEICLLTFVEQLNSYFSIDRPQIRQAFLSSLYQEYFAMHDMVSDASRDEFRDQKISTSKSMQRVNALVSLLKRDREQYGGISEASVFDLKGIEFLQVMSIRCGGYGTN